jgi:hypothetical protein
VQDCWPMTDGPIAAETVRLAGRKSRGSTRVWVASIVAVALVVAGSLWLALGTGGALSVAATVSDCSDAMSYTGSGPDWSSGSVEPTVAGVGTSAGIAVSDTDGRWRWCFVGMGMGTGPISSAAMRAPVAVPLVLLDGYPPTTC